MKTLFDNVLTVLCQNSAEALLLLRLCLGINKIAKALLHSGLVSTNSYFPYNHSIARNSALSGQSQSTIVTPFLEIGATVRKQQRNVKERSWSPKLSTSDLQIGVRGRLRVRVLSSEHAYFEKFRPLNLQRVRRTENSYS